MKKTYYAITAPSVDKFNEKLKKLTDDGYEPIGGIAIAVCCDLDNVNYYEYSVLLCKTN